MVAFMSEEKTNSPTRKESFTIKLSTVFKPIRRTTQFYIDPPSTTKSATISQPKRAPTPYPQPLLERAPTTYRNPKPHTSCQFSKEEIEISNNAPNTSLDTVNKLTYPYGYPPSTVKLATAEQLKKIQNFRKNERERRERKSTDLIAP